MKITKSEDTYSITGNLEEMQVVVNALMYVTNYYPITSLLGELHNIDDPIHPEECMGLLYQRVEEAEINLDGSLTVSCQMRYVKDE